MASTGLVSPEFDSTMGVIQTLNQGIYRTRLERGVPWCLDNGVYTNRFEVSSWLKKIETLRDYKDTCLFITIPDVVGNSCKTINQFYFYRDMIKDFPVAFVSQDGIKNQESRIPWNDFDCLFVGGSNEHKLGEEGEWIIKESKKCKKWVHVGRVNSKKRILKFWYADSWDGTHLGFMPTDVSKFHDVILQVRDKKKQKGQSDGLYFDVFSGDCIGKSV